MKQAAASDIFKTVTCMRTSLGASSWLLSKNTKYMSLTMRPSFRFV